MPNDFANKLISLRSSQNLTQQQLADAVGITPSQISRYEAGQAKPRKTIVLKLAAALGVEASDLVRAPEGEGVEVYGGFSSRLIELRCRKKIGYRSLSKLTGIDSGKLQNLELGKTKPSSNDVYALAAALQVEVSELAGHKHEDEAVSLNIKFSEHPGLTVEAPVTPSSYASMVETARHLNLTPEELLSRFIESLAEAARDPENASDTALSLLEALQFK